VVAPHVVEPIAERPAPHLEEPLVLLGGAEVGVVALGDDDDRVELGDLGDRGGVHGLGVGRLAGQRGEDRTGVVAFEVAALDLAEVDVVDGGEGGEQLAAGPIEGAYVDAVEVVHGAGGQPGVAAHLGPEVADHLVVGDGGDVELDLGGHAGDGTAHPATTS
jgi:hypothetical protein